MYEVTVLHLTVKPLGYILPVVENQGLLRCLFCSAIFTEILNPVLEL